MSKAETFAHALARLLATRDGLTVAYLPDGAAEGIARSVVRFANDARSLPEAFAILIGQVDVDQPDPLCPEFSPQTALKYRLGNRLAVVVGRPPELASFVSAFSEGMSQSFPEGPSGKSLIREISPILARQMLADAGIEPDQWDAPGAARKIELLLLQLRSIHSAAGQQRTSWTTNWLQHVRYGVQAFVGLLRSEMDAKSDITIDRAFREYLYAAFGVPAPEDGQQLLRGVSSLGLRFVEALETWWTSESQVAATIALLEKSSGVGTEPLLRMDWQGYDLLQSVADTVLGPWFETVRKSNDNVRNFSHLTEADFFNPIKLAPSARRLTIENEMGTSLSAIEGGAQDPFLVLAHEKPGEIEAAENRWLSPVSIRVPLVGAPDQSAIEASRLSVALSAAGWEWEASRISRDGDGLLVRGEMRSSMSTTAPAAVAGTITLSIELDDSLANYIPPVASARLVIAPDNAAGLLVMEMTHSGAKSFRVLHQTSDENGGNDAEAIDGELRNATAKYRVLVWGTSGIDPLHEKRPMSPLSERGGVFHTQFTPQEANEFEVGDRLFRLNAPQEATSQFSPLIAAIYGQDPSTGEIPPGELNSLRAKYEQLSVERAGEIEWLDALGHVALSTSDDGDLSDLGFHAGVAMPRDSQSPWDEVVGARVDPALSASDEAVRFREAFVALDLTGIIREHDLPQGARWPSRYSKRRFWERDRPLLQEYLIAYEQLVVKARGLGDSFGVFWATYPFSMSGWSLRGIATGSAVVLLSPWHPIRLAWLASAESTIWNGPDTPFLAGTIQGSSFPAVGPDENDGGRMLAVGVDSGFEQLYLGWSMLARASVTGHQTVSAPARMGGTAAPGSAASGLNADAVSAALRTYRRMNPQVSTLTIDLSSSSVSPRLDEIDTAVIGSLKSWESDASLRLPGGARILDSVYRTSPPPIDQVTDMVRTFSGLPITWSRYEPVTGSAPACNIRLLQDAGIKIRVGESTTTGLGVVADVPLRRFQAAAETVSATRTSISKVGLNSSTGWLPFTKAIAAVEGNPAIESRLFGSLLIDKNAEWTVSGESLLSASAIAGMLASDSNHRMLWEWRPPILEQRSKSGSIDRRAYVSVARVPVSFREQLRQLLEKAKGLSASQSDVDELLSILGARGVGLSSLLAIGGTQASGALGFYLGFALMDRTSRPDQLRFVVPIDASDTFLMALADSDQHAGSQQRADLLIIDISDAGVTLVPVEIKFYGLGTETSSGVLPTPERAAFGEPLAQVAATTKLLNGIVDARAVAASLDARSSLLLWSNALAALVEAAAKLTPTAAQTGDEFAWRLTMIANAELPVRVGKPLIAYFNHEASFTDGSRYATNRTLGAGSLPADEFGSLVADSATAFSAVSSGDSALIRDWADLVDWAVESTSRVEESGSDAAPGEVRQGEAAPDQQVDARSGSALAKSSGDELGSYEDVDEDVAPEVLTHFSESINGTDVVIVSTREAPELSTGASNSNAHENYQTRRSDNATGDGINFPVGSVLGSIGKRDAYFWPSNTALNQMNIGVVGDLGTGKTQLLKSLVYRLRVGAERTQENALSFLIFDYKRDFQEPDFIDAVGGEILRPQRIPLNFFAIEGAFSAPKAYQRATMFCDVIGKIYGGVGPVQRQNLSKAIVEGFSGPDKIAPTLAEVLEAYEALAGKPDAVSSILTGFVMAEVFSEQKDELVSFDQLISDKVLVLALSDLGVDQEGKNALVVLFLNMYYEYMLKSTKWPFAGNAPQLRQLNSYLLIDEATNIMKYDFPVLMDLMLQGREFGFGVILASQYLSHYRTKQQNYGQPLRTWFIHKVPDVTERELSQLGMKDLPAGVSSRITALAVHEAMYSSLNFEGSFIRGTPFFELVEAIE